MPIYEYICSVCGLRFELRRQYSQAAEGTTCPNCNNVAERTFSVSTPVSKDEHGVSRPIGRPWGYYEP
ncbi:FmdB family zinc ribbon protein [Candidatus Omnitrophota bacterium]